MLKRRNFMKKAVSMACVSAVLVAGVPSVRAFAEDNSEAAVTAGSPESAATVTGGSMQLAPAAADSMQKIYECLIKEGSDFSKWQKEMAELFGDSLVYSASINGNTITITVTGKGDYAESSGSWDYTLEGDYLTYVPKEGDYQGEAYLSYLTEAVSDYLGMDSDLVNGYVLAIGAKNLKSNYYIIDMDAEGNATKCKLYVGGAYEMDEVLNSVYLDKDSLEIFDAMDDNYSSSVAHVGKILMTLNGKRTSADFVFGEHGELSELTYKSIIEAVTRLQPVGYEEFLENYKELSEVSTDTYQVAYITDTSELPESLQSKTNYKFIKLHFSMPALSATSVSLKAGGFEFLSAEDCEVKSWSSSNKKVATVQDGQITALKKGTATITATLTDGKKLTCKVKVTSNPTMKIGGKAYKKNQTYTVKKGKTIKAVITGKAFEKNNTYQSSKKKIAKITTTNKSAETVKIKGVKKGTSKITIKVNGVSFVFKVKVK